MDASRRSAALFVARDVAVRATDRSRIARSLPVARRQTRFPESVRWDPWGLSGGSAGIALLCSYLDQCLPQEGWDSVGHGFLAEGAAALERGEPTQIGLFDGLSGFAFAVDSLSRNGDRYRHLLEDLDEMLAPRASAVAARIQAGTFGLPACAFDTIYGASGVAAHLLRRDPFGVLRQILTAMVRRSEPDSHGAPRWATPPEMLASESMRRAYPSGQLNCGLAHGIPGPLAVLSLSLGTRHEVPGQADAVRSLARWLLAHRANDAWGGSWPDAVPLGPDGRAAPQPPAVATRAAWCYGNPGVARSLWLAGGALDDDELRLAAIQGLMSVLRRPVELRYLGSPTYCHGVAGLLNIVLRFAQDTESDALEGAATALVDELLVAYDPELPFGYASVEADDAAVDRAGLLNGAAGIAMVLMAASAEVEPAWDRMFLLS
ncbi:lanthionine synthetase C family protein [Streptomyces sp. NPDC055796]